MRPLRNILVPLDGSPFAESVLPMAIDVARRAAARLTLATVHTPAPVAAGENVILPDAGFDDEMRADIRAYLDFVRRRIARDAEETAGVSTLLLEGPVAETLADYAVRGDVDLVVLATHGRGGASRFWLGSVTDALVRRLDVPALVVRPPGGPTPPSGSFRRVLVPVDGTPESALGADAAVAALGTLGVEYTLLRVASSVARGLAPFATTEGVEADAAAQREAALGELSAVERHLRDLGAEAHAAVRFARTPAEGIVAHAAEMPADLIALATHGRGPVGRLLFGGVTDKVLRTATVPVLVWHAGERAGHALAAREAAAAGA